MYQQTKKIMRLYHGTSQETHSGICLYMTENISEAKQYALGLNELGEYNEESFIYCMDIDDSDIEIVEDFMEFDAMKYTEEIDHIIFNPETRWYIVPNVNLTLFENFKNQL